VGKVDIMKDYKKCGIDVTGVGNSTRLCPHQLAELEESAVDGTEDINDGDPETLSACRKDVFVSLLHPTEEDYVAAEGHANAGLRQALMLIERLKASLKETLPYVQDFVVLDRAEKLLERTHYDEVDDGQWRL
jgi:hypothetical protein